VILFHCCPGGQDFEPLVFALFVFFRHVVAAVTVAVPQRQTALPASSRISATTNQAEMAAGKAIKTLAPSTQPFFQQQGR
jgi:hypothetical protein